MINFDHLPLDPDILKALRELSINYVFQPIFLPDGKTVYAWEALMRPANMTVTDLIAEYAKQDKLHVLEVATFFGAMQAYFLRGYKQRVAINSFPSDCMKQEEADVFLDYFGEKIRGLMIIENLEYPYFSSEHWTEKSRSVRSMDNLLAADDFGSGNLVSLLHSKGIMIVAEGIEEKEEFEYLRGLGIDLYQGYYLARPE